MKKILAGCVLVGLFFSVIFVSPLFVSALDVDRMEKGKIVNMWESERELVIQVLVANRLVEINIKYFGNAFNVHAPRVGGCVKVWGRVVNVKGVKYFLPVNNRNIASCE